MSSLSVLPRSWLRTYDDDQPFTLAAPGLIPLTLPATDDSGVQWWMPDPDGWWAPAAVTPIEERSYGDGGYAGPTTFEPRSLTFGATDPCFTAAPDRPTAMRAYRRLLSLLTSRDPVIVTGPDELAPLALATRASGQPKIRWVDDRCFEWSAIRVADDPLKYDPAEWASPQITGLPEPPVGATWPWTWPLDWGGSIDTGSVTVVNRGDEDAQAVYALTGPAPSPVVENAATGVSFQLTRDIGAGETITVDTRSATVKTADGLSVFVDFAGSWPLIAPGANTIRWAAAGAYYHPDAALTVTTGSTWR